MLDRLFGYTVHPFLQLMGLIVLSVGLPMNKVLMSIGTIWLASNLVLQANFSLYWSRLKNSKLAAFIAGILFLHLFGLAYTEDFGYAFRDLNTKLPLFVIPIAIIAFPIKKEWLIYPLIFFISSLFITSCINVYSDWIDPQNDFRSLSLFGSHIRYTILISMGVVVSFYLIQNKKKFAWLFILLIGWFIYYVYRSQVFSGYLCLFMIFIAALVYGSIRLKNKTYKSITLLSILGVVILTFFSIFSYLKPEKDTLSFGKLPEKTALGNPYYHDTTFMWFENGEHVMSYISEKEMRESWNNRATVPYDSLDQNGHKVKHTLIRFMTSKGLTKDARGMNDMTKEDIKLVEQGYTNIRQLDHSPLARLENLKNALQQYSRSGNPNGNSLIERVEHFKVGVSIISDHWILGVGTGDVQNSFNEYYKKLDSQLDKDNWNRAHNQFLTFWITFGIVGFLLFIFLWTWLFYKALIKKSFFVLAFVLVAIGSFLSEDTIETQQGVTFIAYFLGLSQMIVLNKSFKESNV